MIGILKILLLEDNFADAELVDYELQKAKLNFSLQRTDNRDSFVDGLAQFQPDIILSDYNLPSFNGLQALEIARVICAETPFLLVTGNLDDETAANSIKLGAWDYILKDKLGRLVPAINSALKLKEEISEKNRALDDLKKSEAKYQDLYDNAPDMFFSINPDTRVITDCNQTLLNELGYTREEFIGKDIYNFYTWESIKYAKNTLFPLFYRTGNLKGYEIQVVKKDGSIIDVSLTNSAVYNKEGKIIHSRTIWRDITERKRTEKALLKSEELISSIFKTAPIGIGLSSNRIFREANDRLCEMTGYQYEELIGKETRLLYNTDSEYQKVHYEKNGQLENNGISNIETVVKRKDGKLLNIIQSTSPLDHKDHSKGLTFTILDITDRKQLESELVKTVEIINLSPVILFLRENKKGWPVGFVTNNVDQLFGYSSKEFIDKEILYADIIHKDDLSRIENKLEQLIKNGEDKTDFEYRIITKNGETKWVIEKSVILRDSNNIAQSFQGVVYDVTESVLAEQALRKSEEKYRAMLEANQDIVIIKSPDNKISYMNPAAKLKSRKSFSVIDCHEALFGLKTPCKDCTASNNSKIHTHHREITDPIDNTIYLASYFPIKNIDDSDSIMCIYKDITGLRNIENERIRLLNVLEATQNEIYIIDQNNYQIKYANESAAINTGYSKDELLKMSTFDLLVSYSKRTLIEITKSITKKEDEKIVFEAKLNRRDGSQYSVEIHIQLIEQQEERLLLAIVIDITERQKKEELIIKLSKGIEQSPATVVITNLEGRIEFINPKFTETSGYTYAEVEGKNLRILKSGKNDVKVYKELWETITTGGIWHGELLNKKKNGELYWEDAIIGPIKDKNNNITHFIGLKQDISSRKRIEEELRAEKISLSRRVDERTADLSQLNAELAKAVRMKDEFLANMSHELRTPLNAILGLSEVLQEEVYGKVNQNQLKSLKTIEESGRHLLDLINDILDVAKVGAGKVELEIYEVSILSLCQSSLNFIKQIALKKRISYNLKIESTSETIMADERRLKQILINLLSNAVKFTPEGGSIGLTVQDNPLSESVDFIVWDNGIGISTENIQKLFKPFIQIDSSLSREYSGTGLGLTLVKSLTELHGGSITVESTFGKGSSFIISIPILYYTKPDINILNGNGQNFSENNPKTTSESILIIESPEIEIQQLTTIIQQLGINYSIMPQNTELFKAVEIEKPAMIITDADYLLDLGLNNEMDFKTKSLFSNIPFLVISDDNAPEEKLSFANIEYLIRPLATEKIELVFHKYFKSFAFTDLIDDSLNKAVILLVEDNENNIDMMSDYLQKRNFGLLIARNGNEALNIMQQKMPDIVLMDIQMPGMDGIETTKLIRKNENEKIAKVPIIALTALVMPGDEQRCFDAGMDQYMKKPVSLKSLVEKIEEILLNNLK